MTTTTGQDKLDTIRKLLAKAERAGTPEEAEAFDAKAQELMLKYSIDSAVIGQRPGSTDKVGRKRFTCRFYARQKVTLLTGIATAFGCETVYYAGSGTRGVTIAEVFGWESDLALVEVLFASLNIQADREAEAQWQALWRARQAYGLHGKSFKTSFLYGFAVTVGDRLAKQRSQAVTEAEDTAPGTALVLVDRNAAVTRAFQLANPSLRHSSSQVSSSAGYYSGTAAGSRADLGGAGSRLAARGNTAIGGR